ncbi:hypothetical protein [Pinibacter soli]|uniref:DUF4595 domain-containing protein n=1 Tax=Pinibacter soli TaxID=3044211 RepID=A0ABT6RGK3_9BACT|nr:hypothetical protein [Pinibacter soli]MDI3321701.1 hypothetical protein [Pinibacter soli]
MKVRISTIALTLIVIYSMGCKKVYDYIDKNPTATCDACKITQFTTYYSSFKTVRDVSYDKKGNIISIVAQTWNVPNYDYYFRYDNKNRIAERISVYSGSLGGAISWESYRYFKDKIVDTFYQYSGNYHDPAPPVNDYVNKAYMVFQQDALGRITKGTWILEPENPNQSTIYKYDLYSNLLHDPVSLYDNKINPYRTNNMWQITMRDFSANNAIDNPAIAEQYYPEIVSYNSYGLPTKYRANRYTGNFQTTFGFFYDSLEVKYDCDLSKINY